MCEKIICEKCKKYIEELKEGPKGDRKNVRDVKMMLKINYSYFYPIFINVTESFYFRKILEKSS